MGQLGHFDVDMRTADAFFKESLWDRAEERIDEAKKQLLDCDNVHPEVLVRQAVAKDMMASIAMANGQLEKAEGEFKEVIEMLSSVRKI
jgi:cellobiose-specific phosphotransferase system component IIA